MTGHVIHPNTSLDTAPYWEGCRQGRLLFQRCSSCQSAVFHPRALCPYCLADALEWEESKGGGEVYSFTVQHIPVFADQKDWKPIVLGIIHVDEGYHMFSEIDANGAEPSIGQRVQVYFDRVDADLVLPKFRVAA
ncbi:MAG: zinc ribbon domain-containing protein [Rhizobiaceae bacterium]|nr:zinc ribbon domain-containing protein [Rhizobiaceae bacterium]